MQRIEALIDKLRTQFKNKAALSQLLLTTQMIQQEINGEMKEVAVLGSSNVAVFVPNMPSVNHAMVARRKSGAEREYFQLDPFNEADVDEEELKLLELQHQAGLYDQANTESYQKEEKGDGDNLSVNELSALMEVPTFFQQVRNGKLNGSYVSRVRKAEEADRPKSPQVINTLTTDISEADKERFVKNLFRGDSVMYARSIKTIDNFRTLEEAEYWVMRELKTKLGWLNNSDVEYFDRLVYRKFA